MLKPSVPGPAPPLPEWARYRHEVDQRRAGAQLDESDVEFAFDRKAERVTIERERGVQVLYAQDDVVDRIDLNRVHRSGSPRVKVRHTVRSIDDDVVAACLLEQRLRHRRIDADEAGCAVELVRTHDAVAVSLSVVVFDRHPGAAGLTQFTGFSPRRIRATSSAMSFEWFASVS